MDHQKQFKDGPLSFLVKNQFYNNKKWKIK